MNLENLSDLLLNMCSQETIIKKSTQNNIVEKGQEKKEDEGNIFIYYLIIFSI